MKHQFKVGDVVVITWLGEIIKGEVTLLTWYPSALGNSDKTIKTDSSQVPSYSVKAKGTIYPSVGIIETVDKQIEEEPKKGKKAKAKPVPPLQMKFCNIILDKTKAL